MRFSALFQQPAPQQPAGAEPVRAEATPQPEPAVASAPELPDDLDARVRMVGEWQWFEG